MANLKHRSRNKNILDCLIQKEFTSRRNNKWVFDKKKSLFDKRRIKQKLKRVKSHVRLPRKVQNK